jgi:hypothetical protein
MTTDTASTIRSDSLAGRVSALLAAVALFGAIIGAVGCGNNDLVFPGNVPSTPTSEFTPTPTPSA